MPPKKIQKKKKLAKKKHCMKKVQLFDYTDMPHEFEGMETTLIVAGSYEGCGNDTYHRWYPDRVIEKKIGQFEHFENEKEWEAGKALNNWLLKHGMIIKDEFCFNVLIHVSW
jgi:hypothetical protein